MATCHRRPAAAAGLLAAAAALSAAAPWAGVDGGYAGAGVSWLSAQELTIINAGPWPVSEAAAGGDLRRLPLAAKGVVRDTIFAASGQTAGLAVRFRTNARSLLINASLTTRGAGMEMPHMPASGESGFDLYCFDPGSGVYRWVAQWTPPWAAGARTSNLTGPALLPALLPTATGGPATRDFILYLPLYNGVHHVSIGASAAGLRQAPALLLPSPSPSPRRPPVVFYGTSITQGGVVSRPGMAFTNIIGRALQRDVLNFGYSGQGWMETSVASFLVKVVDAGAFVIDCNPNMNHVGGADGIRNRSVPLVQYIRANGHPTTAIVLSEGTRYGNGWTDDWGGT